MFTISLLLLLFSISSFQVCLVNANIGLITPSKTSTDNSNLTCEEFCEISFRKNNNNIESTTAASATASSAVVTEDENLFNDVLLTGKNQSIFSMKRTVNDWKKMTMPTMSQRKEEFQVFMNEDYLQRSSIIYGLARSASEEYLSTTCYRHLKDIEKAALQKEVWAMKVLDSSGAKEAGFLWGHNYWLGSHDGCLSLQNPVYITLSDQYERGMKKGLINDLAPFEMEYRVIYLKHHSPWQVEIKFMSERIIHIGLCLPKACSTSEIYNMTQNFLNQGLYEESNIYDMQPEIINVKNLKPNENFLNKKSLKIVGAILTFTFVMLLIASCMEDKSHEKRIKSTSIWTETKSGSSKDIQGYTMTMTATMTTTNPDTRDPLIWYPTPYDKSFLQKFIKCFDLFDNCKSLFACKDTSNGIPVIDGLRSVSCVWIIFFHVIWYMYFTVDNKIFLISYGERVFFQYVSTAPLLVDLFFTISGFLLAYNFMKNENNIKRIQESNLVENLKAFGKMILHRYLRLAPLYLVVTGIVEIFTAYIEDVSIFHIHERYDQTCTKFWWRNIFFIQNLFPQDELCLNWTWSLSCEMQYYVLASGLLLLYVKYPEKIRNLYYVGLASSIVWTYIVGHRSKYQLSFDVIYNTATDIYINPFIRVMPYFIGIGSGWLLATSKRQFNINPALEKYLWNIAILVFFACIYSTIKRDMTTFATITLLVVGRLSFAGVICWMIIGSATGRGVWWSRFLEWKVFQHLNRLSYAIYLLNPFIIVAVFSLSNSSTNADPILLCVLTSGFVVIVYICSIIFSLSFEIPYCNLSSLLLQKKLKTI